LQVVLDVKEPSVIALTIGDKVQIDRLSTSHGRHVAERHGTLLDPGVATLSLEPGLYSFKTLTDAHLEVVRGGVLASVPTARDPKNPWPPPLVEPPQRGDDLPGDLPTLTVA